ncbi:MAG: hypothetical protein IJT21_02260 [Synergistaceae bacterium]|nr:hypothetical protein [Synergistaceae bacterium]
MAPSDENIANTSSRVKIADTASAVFPGYTYTFKPNMHVEPREYYFTSSLFKFNRKYKAWHRDTSMVFTIIPVHSFITI